MVKNLFRANLKIAALVFFVWVLVPLGTAVAGGPDNDSCLECHGDPAKSSFQVNTEKLSDSVHGDLDCVDCHESITAPGQHAKDLPSVTCSSCHEDEETEFKESVHGTAGVKDSSLAVACKSCHGTHDILGKKNPKSMINALNLPATCGSCHSREPVITQSGGASFSRLLFSTT